MSVSEFLAESKRREIAPHETATADWQHHARTALPKMREALEAVLAIHSVKSGVSPRYASGAWSEPVGWEPYSVCVGCSSSPYPCSTVRAIESALAENGDR